MNATRDSPFTVCVSVRLSHACVKTAKRIVEVLTRPTNAIVILHFLIFDTMQFIRTNWHRSTNAYDIIVDKACMVARLSLSISLLTCQTHVRLVEKACVTRPHPRGSVFTDTPSRRPQCSLVEIYYCAWLTHASCMGPFRWSISCS